MTRSGSDLSYCLKEELFQTLTCILSPEQALRTASEEKLKALEVTEEFGVHLAELTLDPNGVLPIRQLASVLLKQYVEAHWSQHSDKFNPPEATEQAKAAIRVMLPVGLKEPISKVRSSVAYAISAIAHWDWPEEWPELFNLLMRCLTSGNDHAVHGAMRAMTEFSRDLSDQQIPQVAPVMMPEMYRIFLEQEKYSIRTRGRAVEIFCTVSNMICAMNQLNKGITRTLLGPILPSFTEALVQGLQVPNGMTSDSGLKLEIIKALTVLIKNVPRQMSQWLPQILPSVWQTLTQSAQIYVKTVVNNVEEVDQAVDSDGEVLGFESLVFSIFDFVDTLVETPKFSKTVKQGMGDLMYYLILYMQVTEEQIKVWTLSPDQFVGDEDDESISYTVRIAAQDLLLILCQEYGEDSCTALCQTVTRHMQEAEAARTMSANCEWWKIHEACMFALGSARDLVIEQLKEGKVQFDLLGFLQNIAMQDLNLTVSPFLLGRCLWLASRFPHVMNQQMLQHFLQATVSGLQAVQSPCVRVQAVRAVWGFCDHLKAANGTAIMVPLLPSVIEILLTLAFQYSTEVLCLVVETVVIVLSMDKAFTATYESKVTSLAIAVFLKYNSDPVLTSLAQDIFKEVAQNEACTASLDQKLMPCIASILNDSNDKIPPGLQAVALDMLTTVVRSSNPPLSMAVTGNMFPAVAQCVLRSDDNSTMQNGGECLRSFISCVPEHVCSYADTQGRNGLWYAIQATAHLLNPMASEFTAAFVGRLVTALIRRAGDRLGDHLDLLLRAVLSKMQGAETLSVIQSLVMVYAHLVHTQMDAVLNFLSTVPGPTGLSALHFVLTEWCAKQHLFYGVYDRKVSTVALGKLLQHGVNSNDSRLKDMDVKGDQILTPDANHSVQTRSKTKGQVESWTTVPLLVKIYKLLINELSNAMEANITRSTTEEEEVEEEEDRAGNGGRGGVRDVERGGAGDANDEDWEDEANEGNASGNDYDYLGFDDLDGDDDDDPDALEDPLYHINMQQYLTEFLQTFSQQPYIPAFAQHLNQQEKQVLAAINIST